MKVPVGVSTVSGYGLTVIAFAAAVVAYLTGDHSQQTVGTIAAGGVAALAFAITQIGRYVQAKAAIYAQPVPVAQAPTKAGNPPLIDFDGDGVFTPAPVSNAGPVVADPSLQADPTDVAGASDHPVS